MEVGNTFCKDCRHHGITGGRDNFADKAWGDICRKRTQHYTKNDPVDGPLKMMRYALCQEENRNFDCFDFEPKPPTLWQRLKAFLLDRGLG